MTYQRVCNYINTTGATSGAGAANPSGAPEHIGVRARVAQWVRQLDYLTTHTSLSPIRRGFAPGFVNYKKGALDLQAQVIK
jgi:hypothetical protein